MSTTPSIYQSRILLVDDDALAIELWTIVLQAAGFDDVTSTLHAREVVELHKKQQFDLLLIDLLMPSLGGLDLISDLQRSDTPDVPIIVVSADSQSRVAAIRLGAVDFIAKPVDPDELTIRVSNVLETERLKRHLEEEARSHREAAERLALYRSATESSIDAIFIVDHVCDRIVDANLTACKMLGVSQDALLAMPASKTGIQAGSKVKASSDDTAETSLFRLDGSKILVELRSQVLDESDRQLTAHTARDLSQRSEAERRLRQLADFDTLTGLANRRQFFSALTQTLQYADQASQSAAVIFIDVDRFKTINDNLGHGVGDQLLHEFGARVTRCARARDLVSRLGGDEFAILMVFPASADAPLAIANKIREALSEPFVLKEHSLRVTASIGIALYPDDAYDPEMLMQYADIAMYRSKASGRNTYRFFKPEMNQRGLERLKLEAALREALHDNQFRLLYQPKVDTRSGRVSGMEALLRWERPGQGMVSPAEFIPLLEETGLIVQIGAWVIRTACMQIRRWRDEGLDPIPVAVNVSARQFYDTELLSTITDALTLSQIEPHLLSLELTESMLMSNADDMVTFLGNIRRTGVTLTIDDFGTGYSSLAYLKRFPIDTIKIDIAFVRDIISNPEDAAIALAIIRMAHALNMKVVAEGVETGPQLKYLCSHDCDEVQGFYFSPAIAAELVPAIIEKTKFQRTSTSVGETPGVILVVDDDADVCNMLAYCLAARGYNALTSTNVQDAFTILAGNEVHVVLCDQRMPQMAGSEFLRRVKTLYPEVIRIAMSSSLDQQLLATAVNEGAIFKFLAKPWKLDILHAVVRDGLAAYRTTRLVRKPA